MFLFTGNKVEVHTHSQYLAEKQWGKDKSGAPLYADKARRAETDVCGAQQAEAMKYVSRGCTKPDCDENIEQKLNPELAIISEIVPTDQRDAAGSSVGISHTA